MKYYCDNLPCYLCFHFSIFTVITTVFQTTTMDVLAREKAKLEVMMCSSLVLLPNSINILPYTPVKSASEPVPVPHPLATHRITLNIQYADTTFSVLVTMEHSLDFLVTSPLLLPMKYLDDKPFPPNYPNTSLVELVRWLISQLKNSMRHRILVEEKLSGLASAVENLVNMNIITARPCWGASGVQRSGPATTSSLTCPSWRRG
jgi:hypothetical protein